MSSRIVLNLALTGALLLGCTNEQTATANHPEPASSPASGVPDGDHTGAVPNNDIDNNPGHPTPPGTPPEDQRIPEGVAPSK